MHIDDVVEFEKELPVGCRAEGVAAKPLQRSGQRRGPREIVELERENVGAVHPLACARGAANSSCLCSVTTSGFLSLRAVISTKYFQSRTYYKPCLLSLYSVAGQRRCL